MSTDSAARFEKVKLLRSSTEFSMIKGLNQAEKPVKMPQDNGNAKMIATTVEASLILGGLKCFLIPGMFPALPEVALTQLAVRNRQLLV